MRMLFFENERVDQAVSVKVIGDAGMPLREVRRLVAWYMGWELAFRISKRKYFRWVREANQRGGYERPQHLVIKCAYEFELQNIWHSYRTPTTMKAYESDKDHPPQPSSC